MSDECCEKKEELSVEQPKAEVQAAAGMNTELKAMLDLIFDGEQVIEKLVAKQSVLSLLGPMFTIVSADLPKVIANWQGLPAEIAALPGSAQEADLQAYMIAKFKGAWSDAKIQQVLSVVLEMIVCAIKFQQIVVA